MQHYIITLCLFFSLNPHQSSPPGQIMRAESLIMADTSLAEPGWNFSQNFGGRWGRPARTGGRSALLCTTEVKQLHHLIQQPQQVNKDVKAARLAAGSWVQSGGRFVCRTGSLCRAPGPELVTQDLTATSCHTFHTATIKIPKKIRTRHCIQSYTLCSPLPPSALHSYDSV